MISVQPTDDLFHDEPPLLLFDEYDPIPEPKSFLRQLMLKGSSPSTLRAYTYDLLSFYRFMSTSKVSITGITRKYAINYISVLRKQNAAPRTINRRITTVRTFLNSLKQNMGNEIFASSSPCFYKGRRNHALVGPSLIKQSKPGILRVKVPSTLKIPLQIDAIHSFFNSLRSLRDKAIVALMLCLGLRSCEILCLQAHDIDLDASQIRVWGKGGKERLLPISPWIKSSITSYLAFERPSVPHSTCFVVLKGKRRGHPISPEGLRKIFRHRRDKSCFLKNAHAHRFRHTFCTNLIRQKVPLPIVQKLMGHASIDTTLIYINLSLEDVSAEYHRAMEELARIDANETT